MADFLTRMTQRTLGLLPVVQPIIASKYGSESTDAYMPGGSALIDPDQAMEESFEDWEGIVERVPLAPVSQPIVPPGVRAPTAPVPVVPPSSALPQGQPSTPKAQQTKPASVRPHEVQPLRETTGANLPSPLVTEHPGRPVPESGREMPRGAALPGRGQESGQEMHGGAEVVPGRGQARPVPYTKPTPTLIGGEAVPAPTLEIQKNQPFSSAPTASNVPAMKPRRGQAKPSSGSDVGTRFIASRSGGSLVPPQSSGLPQIDQTPGVGMRFTASRTSDPLVSVPSGELPQIDQKPDVGTRFIASRSATHNEGNLVSTSTSPISANTGGNPTANGEGIASARHANTSPERVLTGEDKPAPLPYTKSDADPYRVGAGLVPALVPPARLAPALVPPAGLVPALEAVQSMALPPTLVSTAQVAEASLVEPRVPPVYPSVQNRRAATTAGKGEAAQQAESHDAPTIRVTIGRIDVRAVAPTPPAYPASTKSNQSRPALSLSDYLKQRKGGQQ